MFLLENVPILKQLMNAPMSGADLRAVRQMNLYGLGTIKTQNKTETNRLSWAAAISPVAFQPIG